MRLSYSIAALAALVGAVLAAAALFRPETGVTGTPGAMLGLIGATAVLLGSVLLLAPTVRGRGLRGLLVVLTALGAVLTAVAAWFLMKETLVMAMLVALAGTLLGSVVPVPRPAR